MKIGLVYPHSKTYSSHVRPHLGLAYVASALQAHNHDVTMIDTVCSPKKEIDGFLDSTFDVIGITAASYSFTKALAFAREAKTENRKLKVILGGPYAFTGAEEILKYPEFDFGICGEGELTMPEFMRILESDPNPSVEVLKQVNGLIFRDGTETVINQPRERISDLDSIAFPALHLLPMEKYDIYPLLTSRGCPHQCIFCDSPILWGREWRPRSLKNIMEEITSVLKKFSWGNKPFAIVDDSFNINIQRVIQFCDQLIEQNLNIEWFCGGIRADRTTPELARKMKEAGCGGVVIGVESAVPQILKNMKKGEKIEDIVRGIHDFQQAGIAVLGEFTIGNPGDNVTTVKKSIAFAKKHKLRVDFNMILPYPKTGIYDYIEKHGRWLKTDFTQFHHHINEPVFETDDFSHEDRIKAYKMAKRFEFKQQLKLDLKTLFARLRTGKLGPLTPRRIQFFIQKMMVNLFRFFAHQTKHDEE